MKILANRTVGRLAAAGAAVVLAASVVGCSSNGGSPAPSTSESGTGFQSVSEGNLTVAATMPVKGLWDGVDAASLSGGVEYNFSQWLAKQLGLKLEVMQTQWTPLISGTLTGYDIGMNAIFRTEERMKVNQYSDCYGTSPSGLIARADLNIKTVDDLKKLRVGVTTGSFQQLQLQGIDFATPLSTFPEAQPMLASLTNGTLDVVALDFDNTAGRISGADASKFKIAGVLKSASHEDPCYAIQLPKSAPESNVKIINDLIKKMLAEKLWDGWKQESFPDAPKVSDYPVIEIP